MSNWSSDTEEFIKHFDGRHIFVTMPEFKMDGKPFHYHSELSTIVKDLVNANLDDNRAVFFTVNELDRELDPGKHRTTNMFVRARAIFLDDDKPREAPRDDFPLEPSLIVNSSPGKYHYYWLTDTINVDEWKAVQNGLVVNYEGDRQARDVPRYLRLPGFYHLKKDRWLVEWNGDGIVYSWEDVKRHFEPLYSKKSVDNGSSSILDGKCNVDAIEEIKSGLNYHENLVSLSYQMKQEGVGDRYIILALQGFMNCVSESKRDDRWQSRYEDIERIVRGATVKSVIESIENVSDNTESASVITGGIPWPPGLLGGLCEDAYNMARFQYKEVAVISALGLIAGITGRKFNVSNTGLNLYLTLIMQTGMGKDSISEFIMKTLYGLNEHGNSSSFVGPVRFTGPRAIIKSLESARSQVSVFTEAGLLLKSRAGDREGLARVLLSIYGRSGFGQYTGGEMFSKDEDHIKPLHAPALTIINEATPETLLEAFSDDGSLERGELPRQSIYRIHGDKPKANRTPLKAVRSIHVEKLKHLVSLCSKIQAVDDHTVYDMVIEPELLDDVYTFADEMVDIENECRGSDSIRSIMSSRMWLKAVKFAALASVYNHDRAVICRDEWFWAKSMVEYEMNGLESFFSGSSYDSNDLGEKIISPVIVKILQGKYNDPKKQSSKQERAKGIFARYAVKQALRNHANFKGKKDRSGRSLIDVHIDGMIKDGMLFDMGNGKVRITEMFSLLVKKGLK
jgi:hypothetical protein